ncbi:hypothetical protein Scep_000881 [Stephania cephalantha]|uniref:Uncharacterized protein n=1 Tax=Stephania cephalantha TaxID=152367 RepID=A0AAP0L9M7_9MAGN
MKPSLRYSSAALRSVKHKNDEPSPSIASSRFRRNRASDRSITRHRAVHPVAAATASLPLPRRRCRRPLTGAAAGATRRCSWNAGRPLRANRPLLHRCTAGRPPISPDLLCRCPHRASASCSPLPAVAAAVQRRCLPSPPPRGCYATAIFVVAGPGASRRLCHIRTAAVLQFLAAVSTEQPPPAAALLLLRAITTTPRLLASRTYRCAAPRRKTPSSSLRAGALRHLSLSSVSLFLTAYLTRHEGGNMTRGSFVVLGDDFEFLAHFLSFTVSTSIPRCGKFIWAIEAVNSWPMSTKSSWD